MDFLGSTTPQNLIASVTSGVQSTTEVLFPFLIFAGIPIAFVILRYLMSFIKSTVGRTRNN